VERLEESWLPIVETWRLRANAPPKLFLGGAANWCIGEADPPGRR